MEIQACQPVLDTGEGHGTDHPECHHMLCAGQPENQAQMILTSGFMKGRSCLTNLISFYHKVTWLVDKGKAVDFVYPDFSKALDTVTHSILLGKLGIRCLGGCSLHWVKNWQDSQAQRVVLNGVKSSWQLVSSGAP